MYYHDRKYFAVTGSNFTLICLPLFHNRRQQGLGAGYLVLLGPKHTENMAPKPYSNRNKAPGLVAEEIGGSLVFDAFKV